MTLFRRPQDVQYTCRYEKHTYIYTLHIVPGGIITQISYNRLHRGSLSSDKFKAILIMSLLFFSLILGFNEEEDEEEVIKVLQEYLFFRATVTLQQAPLPSVHRLP